MEYTYIRDIDKIIEDKNKLKEVILFLLNTNAKRYDDYTSKQLYDVFCEETLSNFIDILNNMSSYEFRLEGFSNYVYDFHRTNKIDLKNKIEFLLNHNYSFVDDSNDSIGKISFEEYLFKCDTKDVKDCLECMVEYYEKYNDLTGLEKKIDKFEVFQHNDITNIWVALNLKYIITFIGKGGNHKKFITFCRKKLKKYFSEKKENLELYNKKWRMIVKENKC
jgi:hypothetical protein